MVPRPLGWTQVPLDHDIRESKSARTLVFDVPGWPGHRPGQHVDVRLTAPDGYQAARSYSLSSAPDESPRITVERVDDGEVSPFLVDVLEVGEEIELRGPVGGYFVWDPAPEPLLLIGGGSGIAPLRAMWRSAPDATSVTVLYSARDRSRIIFADELSDRSTRCDVRIHLTREVAPGYVDGRIDRDALVDAVGERTDLSVFLCGPTAFVESIAAVVSDLVDDRSKLRVERFG